MLHDKINTKNQIAFQESHTLNDNWFRGGAISAYFCIQLHVPVRAKYFAPNLSSRV